MTGTSRIGRRDAIKWTIAGVSSLASVTHANGMQTRPMGSIDWSQRLVESTMKRNPDPARIGPWDYQISLFLFGQYLLFTRTKERRLLDYIIAYVDAHVDEHGVLDIPIESLDTMLGANLLVVLFEQTHAPKYKLAADRFRRRFDTYPRTTDGGLWHGNRDERAWQLWLDGVYMSMPFLLRYGRAFGDARYANAEAVKQLLVYHKHLRSDHMGLLYYAYDESGKAPWADPATHHSGFFWCRSLGWFAMTIVDTLDVIPPRQPGRSELIAILRDLVRGLEHFQDAESGLWYQVLDQPTLAGNWLETSSACMFTYAIDIAVKRGYIASHYRTVAQKGYDGAMRRLTLDAEGMTNITDICVGTNVGDLAWYLARPHLTNDNHGLGAFLLMNEEWHRSVSSMKTTV